MRRVPDIRPREEENVDGSVFDEVSRCKDHLTLENMFLPKDDEENEEEEARSARTGVICLPRQALYFEMLNALCFLNALSPLTVGPDMGPLFKAPVREKCRFYSGVVR